MLGHVRESFRADEEDSRFDRGRQALDVAAHLDRQRRPMGEAFERSHETCFGERRGMHTLREFTELVARRVEFALEGRDSVSFGGCGLTRLREQCRHTLEPPLRTEAKLLLEP